ncbi:protein of unknown function [Thermomonospora echinospora]|uniref:DUF4253 domain-containing protein n=1 Tax=Thermomonospora echinospora TaxID=1992 RepID=A0A1H6DUQ3_9ACTN|nr:DUF4253 domain-containing protein [Thermomonospora echinospora]SEG89112.1 protein of unknown function [Thermomonospora echinospora]
MDDHERRPAPPAELRPPGLRHLFGDGGVGRTLAAELPPGTVVWPDPGYPQRHPVRRPAFWVSDGPVPAGLWGTLRSEHPRSGLWPVLLDESTQPWSAGQVAPEPVSEIDNYDPAAFMAEVWSDWCAHQIDGDYSELDPYGKNCPGLAPPGIPVHDPDELADRYAAALTRRGLSLGLAAVERGADALTAMGWQGALNHNEWTAPLAAVVRGWEERFGARVVGLGFNTLDLSVAAPPLTSRHALQVAAEHWAFCPDTMFQGPGTLIGYAEEIRGKTAWSFWWD